jgi:hypothetical protein
MRRTKAVRWAVALGALSLLSGPTFAQFGLGPNMFDQTDRERRENEKKERENKEKRPTLLPFASVLADAFPPADWAALKVSTSTTKEDLSKLLRGGFYRLELVTLVLTAKRAGEPLSKLVQKRQDGDTLRSIAEGCKIGYDALFDDASSLKLLLDRRAEVLEAESPRGQRPPAGSVDTSTAAAVSASSAPAAALSSSPAVSLSSAPAVALSSSPAVSLSSASAVSPSTAPTVVPSSGPAVGPGGPR